MEWRRRWVLAGMLMAGIAIGTGAAVATFAAFPALLGFAGPSADTPDVARAPPVANREPKPSPLAKNFNFKQLITAFFEPIRDPKYGISQNRDRSDYPGRSSVTCLGICFCAGRVHEKHVFDNLIGAVKAEIVAKGGEVDFYPGGIAYDVAKFWSGAYSVTHNGDCYTGTARVWCIADAEAPNLGQRFTVIVTLDETGP